MICKWAVVGLMALAQAGGLAAERGHPQAENEARGLQGLARVCRNAITGCRMF